MATRIKKPKPTPIKKNTPKKWGNYQVDYGSCVKTVAELTEKEAKDELCKAMDTLEKTEEALAEAQTAITQWRYQT